MALFKPDAGELINYTISKLGPLVPLVETIARNYGEGVIEPQPDDIRRLLVTLRQIKVLAERIEANLKKSETGGN